MIELKSGDDVSVACSLVMDCVSPYELQFLRFNKDKSAVIGVIDNICDELASVKFSNETKFVISKCLVEKYDRT